MTQQPAYGQGGQMPPGGYGPPAQQGTNTMAILALIFAFVVSPLGIVFGVIARRQIRQSGEQGAGLAKAGLIIGIVFTVLTVLAVLLPLALALSGAGSAAP